MKSVTSKKAQAIKTLTDMNLSDCPSNQEYTPVRGDDPDFRREMIATAAYFRAEQRGFEEGHDAEDWFAAEAEIERTTQPFSGM